MLGNLLPRVCHVEQNNIIIDNFLFGDHNSNTIYHGKYYQDVTVDPLLDLTFYVYIDSRGFLYTPFEVSDEFDFFEQSFEQNIILGLFIGSLTFFVIYALIMILITKQSLYFQYILFVIGMLSFYLYQEGFFLSILANQNGFHDYLYPFLISFTTLSCSIFSLNYTQIKLESRPLYYLVITSVCISILSLFLSPFYKINILTIISLLNFQFLTFTLLSVGILLCFKRKIEGVFILVSLFFFSAGVYAYIAGALGLLNTVFLPKYFLQIGHSIELLVWSIAIGLRVYSLKSIIKHQKHDLHYDSLTNILNRKGIDYSIDKLISTNKDCTLSVAIIDIDHFKKINDQYGHNIGDEALQYFANFLSSHTREYDILGRWGGEEFILITYDTDQYIAKDLVEDILYQLNKSPYINGDINIPITFSSGIFTCYAGVDDFDFSSIVNKADKKLYIAKESGRNKVCI